MLEVVRIQYYNFTIDGLPVGYFVMEESAGAFTREHWEIGGQPTRLRMTAYIAIAGQREENEFTLRFDGERPTQVRVGDGQWQPVPEGAYPTSAYESVLRAGLTEYEAYVEGTGDVETRRIVQDGDEFVEFVDGAEGRKFRIDGDDIVYICWGDTAESRLVASKAEAVRGTVYEE